MTETKVWGLDHDTERFRDFEVGYAHDLSRGAPKGIEEIGAPSVEGTLLYTGYPPHFEGVDFPVSDDGSLVMSRRMLNALDAAGEFQREVVPVEVTDYPLQLREWRSSVGDARADAVLHGYVVVRGLANLDPDRLDESALPPLFQLGSRTPFVSSKARAALETAGIVGVAFW
ncbi:MAG: hypothetical protein IPK82_07530 [Polyangiaceae bacterium]|nr:hypothetical protein [Polyangiaceae bacterium]